MSHTPRFKDPVNAFRGSRTPPGLYARQKWLGEASAAQWKTDFDVAVARLSRGPFERGLWNGSALETIHRLFGLHLTVRDPNPQIDAALNRLLALAIDAPGIDDPPRVEAGRLRGLPFAPADRRQILVPACLFLCTIFDRKDEAAVLDLYESAASEILRSQIRNTDPAAGHNQFRALVVHPQFARHAATRAMVERLAARQTSRGDWGPDLPFFQTFNALAHLDHPKAAAQCRKAAGRLAATQNADGTWGGTQREWSTFLTVHALRNMKML
jgi:hypothetical protein